MIHSTKHYSFRCIGKFIFLFLALKIFCSLKANFLLRDPVVDLFLALRPTSFYEIQLLIWNLCNQNHKLDRYTFSQNEFSYNAKTTLLPSPSLNSHFISAISKSLTTVIKFYISNLKKTLSILSILFGLCLQ